MKYSNVRMSIEDKELLKKHYGTIQNAVTRLIEKEKEFIKKQKEFMATLEGK